MKAAGRARRFAWRALAPAVALVVSACSHDWGPFEPSSGSGSAGGGGASSSTTTHAGGASASSGANTGGSAGRCGDGRLDDGEECDDQNATDGDGCTHCHVDCAEDGAFKNADTHHCYWIVADESQWSSARGKCSGPGHVDAAALSTQDELDFLRAHLIGSSWLGGHYVVQDHAWAWTNGETWSYGDDQGGAMSPWTQVHHDHHGALQCVSEETTGKIEAQRCDLDLPIVCERSPSVARP